MSFLAFFLWGGILSIFPGLTNQFFGSSIVGLVGLVFVRWGFRGVGWAMDLFFSFFCLFFWTYSGFLRGALHPPTF